MAASLARSRKLDVLRLLDRRRRAVAGAKAAIEALRHLGVTAEFVGSLADERFNQSSDIDLLVTDCPRRLKYAIESVVEDCVPGFSFDVLYLDELPPYRAARYLETRHGDRS